MWTGERWGEPGKRGSVAERVFGSIIFQRLMHLDRSFQSNGKHEAGFDLGYSGLAALMTWALFLGCILGHGQLYVFYTFFISKHYLIIRHSCEVNTLI
jgi:hypothetical protein